jgi:hypothetical protein
MTSDHRKNERKETINLLDYVIIDESGNPINRAMARTLNVSEKGILFETHLDLERDQLLIITIGLANDLCEIEGRIVRTEKTGDETFCYGVEFAEVKEENIATLRKFLNHFNENQ